jgi:hypothetical protein
MIIFRNIFYLFNDDFSKIINLISCYLNAYLNDKQFHKIFTSEHVKTSMKNNLEIFISFILRFSLIISYLKITFRISYMK